MAPLSRAITLLKIYNIDFDLVKDSILGNDFLLEQMETHEQIDEASMTCNLVILEQIEKEINSKREPLIQTIQHSFAKNELKPVIELVKQLAFYDRLLNLITNTINRIL